MAAKMPKASLPAGVVVSIAAPWPGSTLSPAPRSASARTKVTQCRRSRLGPAPPRGALRPKCHGGRGRAPAPVELPAPPQAAPPQGLEAGREPGPVVALARGAILVEVAGPDPGGEQDILLRGEGLRTVGL